MKRLAIAAVGLALVVGVIGSACGGSSSSTPPPATSTPQPAPPAATATPSVRILSLDGHDISEADLRLDFRQVFAEQPGGAAFCQQFRGLSAADALQLLNRIAPNPTPGGPTATPAPGVTPRPGQTANADDNLRGAAILLEECQRVYGQ